MPNLEHEELLSGAPVENELRAKERIAPKMAPPELVSVRRLITPADAARWLENKASNRPLSESRWYRYAIDMIEGRWELNGEAIIIGSDGRLIDGQHRLKACVESDISFWSMVTEGAAPESFHTIDTGGVRTAADLGYIAGIQGAAGIMSAAGLLASYRKGVLDKSKKARMKPTKSEVVAFALRHKEGLIEAGAHANGRARAFLHPSILIFAYYLFIRQNQELAERFFADLHEGSNLDESNAVLRLRNRLIDNRSSKRKLGRLELIALVFKSWIAYRDGTQQRILVWKKDEPFPNIDRPTKAWRAAATLPFESEGEPSTCEPSTRTSHSNGSEIPNSNTKES